MPRPPLPAKGAVGPARAARLTLLSALAVGALAAFVAPARATPARALALAAGDYLEDGSTVFRWPGSARDHAGRWWLDSGRIDPVEGWTADGEQPRTGPSAGVVWTPGAGSSPWTAGFAVDARTADGDHVGLHRDGPGAGFTGLAGRALGPVDIAAAWRSVYGGWSSDDDAPDEFEHHRDDVALGARFDLTPGAYVDVAADRRHQRNRMEAPGDAPAWETGNLASWDSWSARARAFIALGEHAVLTPVAEILREEFSGPVVGEQWLPELVADHDNRLLRFGAALCWLPDPDRLVALTVERLDFRTEPTLLAGDGAQLPAASDQATTSLRVATERRLNWWLSLRASLAWTQVSGADSYFDPAGGAALHLGPWGADLAVAGAPLPEPWRWLSPDPGADLWLRASIHRDF